ncbi:sodium:alanine symporter family protein [Gammaproteobacteria bacterium]|nr:sodium:alanine symporter family protein [Gammaproteobacteria bacterium]
METLNNYILLVDSYFGSAAWFPLLLLSVGIFFTAYLGVPQFKYFLRGWKILFSSGKGNEGQTSPFQALSTALSGTVGTGNIGGVAMAIFIGGPAALFWMWITAFLGMTTKFVEVSLSHAYREKNNSGEISGGPMVYMEKGLNMKWLGMIFAFSLLISTFGSGNMPQIDNISSTIESSFGIDPLVTSIVMSLLVALVIIGGIKRISTIAASIVPLMAFIYLIGGLSVLIFNYENIVPSFQIIILDVFEGTSVVGGFLGASFSLAFTYGVARGLYSNEAGQGSAPIAHATSRTKHSVEEGFVSILEPFIDTIIICTLTGLVILSSGVWTEKFNNSFERTSMYVIDGTLKEEKDGEDILNFLIGKNSSLRSFSGDLNIISGEIQNKVTILNNRSIAEEVTVNKNGIPYTGKIKINNSEIDPDYDFVGKSLVKSAVLTSKAFNKGFFGSYGEYIVSIGLLLFAFSTVITWAYYGDRCSAYLFGESSIIYYRVLYILAFFIAGSGYIDTEIIWNFALITVAASTLPNLISIFLLRNEMKRLIDSYINKTDD